MKMSAIRSLCLCILSSLMVASVAFAQTPRVNTKDASIPKAKKTTKANLRKAGGAISKGSRKVGKAISQAGRNVQKEASRTVGKKP